MYTLCIYCTLRDVTRWSGAMDTFARALKAAVKIIDDGVIPQAVKVTSGCGSVCTFLSAP